MNESEHFTGSMGLGSLLEAINVPDIMTPDQFFGRVGASSELSSEQRLKLAILEDAIACYQGSGAIFGNEQNYASTKRGRLGAEALEWIEGGAALISFDDCCEALGWNPEWLRAGIKRGVMGPMPNHGQHHRSPASTNAKVVVTRERPRHTSAFAPLTGHQVVMDGLFQEVAE